MISGIVVCVISCIMVCVIFGIVVYIISGIVVWSGIAKNMISGLEIPSCE